MRLPYNRKLPASKTSASIESRRVVDQGVDLALYFLDNQNFSAPLRVPENLKLIAALAKM
jgi:hypothetical protein